MNESSEEKIRGAMRLAGRIVVMPSILAMLTPILGYHLANKYAAVFSNDVERVNFFFVCLIVGFVTGWLVWSFQTPKWRLLAYKMVDDIEELKKRALGTIIWSDDSIFTKTEIASPTLREEIQKIELEKKSAAKKVP